MNIPAYAFPALCIGRTFDVNSSKAGVDIFPPDIPPKTTEVNTFSFQYKFIKTNRDVRELLDLPGDLPLKIKANVLEVDGPGKYLQNYSTEEGTTEVVAVMKCTTVLKTMDKSVKPREELATGASTEELGTHYVRSVTYGAEMVARLTFKTSTASKGKDIRGRVEGQLTPQAVNTGLKDQLDTFVSELSDAKDISIEYYATDLREPKAKDLTGLVKVIQDFPFRVNNDGPLKFELQPVQNVLPSANPYSQNRALVFTMEEVENCFDDLRNAHYLVTRYSETTESADGNVARFYTEINQVLHKFRIAISDLNMSGKESQFEDCLTAYGSALDGFDEGGKFLRHWRKLLASKVELPKGKSLTILLIGKSGCGKSATANSIVGQDLFKTSSSANSATSEFQFGRRIPERLIDVLDTPGILDTSILTKLGNSTQGGVAEYSEIQASVLSQVSKILEKAPNGFDAVILVARYGCRFTAEDAQALKLLQGFLGEEANEHMVLVLTFGDQAEHEAEESNVTRDVIQHLWIGTLPDWVQEFVRQIDERIVLFNNRLKPDKHPEAYRRQLSNLIQVIDAMSSKKSPFLRTKPSRDELYKKIEEVMDASRQSGTKKHEPEKRKRKGKEPTHKRNQIKNAKEDVEQEEDDFCMVSSSNDVALAIERKEEASDSIPEDGTRPFVRAFWEFVGGCFPGSAVCFDKHGHQRNMDSLQVGEEVLVVTNKEIRLDSVITFIHRQPDVMQEYLKIRTTKSKILKITEDHLLFVKTKGQATAVPASDVKIGDTLYVRVNDVIEEDSVQDISSVFEKGVYAPVTLSGTILVNDVLASCYFDVLSHEWSHMAMGIARTLYHVSPWVVQWISSIGQKDGFPGWCRLVHTMLTLLN